MALARNMGRLFGQSFDAALWTSTLALGNKLDVIWQEMYGVENELMYLAEHKMIYSLISAPSNPGVDISKFVPEDIAAYEFDDMMWAFEINGDTKEGVVELYAIGEEELAFYDGMLAGEKSEAEIDAYYAGAAARKAEYDAR